MWMPRYLQRTLVQSSVYSVKRSGELTHLCGLQCLFCHEGQLPLLNKRIHIHPFHFVDKHVSLHDAEG